MLALKTWPPVEQQFLCSVSRRKKNDFFHSTDEKPNICILFIRNENKAGSQPGVVQNMSSLDKLYFSTVDT